MAVKFASTCPTIPEWYARLGWKHIGEDMLLGH